MAMRAPPSSVFRLDCLSSLLGMRGGAPPHHHRVGKESETRNPKLGLESETTNPKPGFRNWFSDSFRNQALDSSSFGFLVSDSAPSFGFLVSDSSSSFGFLVSDSSSFGFLVSDSTPSFGFLVSDSSGSQFRIRVQCRFSQFQ